MLLAVPACGDDSSKSRQYDRWVTTQNTTVDIDWDAIGKAYKSAEGPEDFENKVNEIYTGSEIISVAVHDTDAKTQEVVGFFDKDKDGKVADGEKIFTLTRDIKGPDSAEYRIRGAGGYSSYQSPVWPLLAGVATGYMVGRIFSPSYSPAYTQRYVTPTTRHSELTSHRTAYRQKNPQKFTGGAGGGAKPSKTGKSYGSKGGGFGGGRSSPAPSRPSSRPSSSSRGGGRFGIKRRAKQRIRLEA